MPHQKVPTRRPWQTYEYDWLGNVTQSDDDRRVTFDRSIGNFAHSATKPYQFTSAAPIASGTHVDRVPGRAYRVDHEVRVIEGSEHELKETLGVVSVSQIVGIDAQDTIALRKRYSEARAILSGLEFVKGISAAWFGGGIGEIVAVFLFNYRTEDDARAGWVVCGDIPWLFTPFVEGDSSRAVLERYIRCTRQWNREGGIAPTGCRFGRYRPERSRDLDSRLGFIEAEVLPTLP